MYLMPRWWIAEALEAVVKAINITNMSVKSLSDSPYPKGTYIVIVVAFC